MEELLFRKLENYEATQEHIQQLASYKADLLQCEDYYMKVLENQYEIDILNSQLDALKNYPCLYEPYKAEMADSASIHANIDKEISRRQMHMDEVGLLEKQKKDLLDVIHKDDQEWTHFVKHYNGLCQSAVIFLPYLETTVETLKLS